MKTEEQKKSLIDNYYINASKHVFTNKDFNKPNFYKVGLMKKKDSNEEYGYSINIVNDNVSITIQKISKPSKVKSYYSDMWFPVYEKRMATKQFKDIRVMMSMVKTYIETIVNFEEIKYGRKYITFNFTEKFKRKFELEKKVVENL